MKLLPLAALLGAFLSTIGALEHKALSQERGLTEAEKKTLLDEHNNLRRLQAQGMVEGQPAAADMTRLEWSEKLEANAQEEADKCHNVKAKIYRKNGEGQNYVFARSGKYIISLAFKNWFDRQVKAFKYNDFASYKSASRYITIVTGYTTLVGCGAKNCTERKTMQLYCNYFMGSIKNVRPYKTGEACSKCPKGFGYCEDHLCAKTCKDKTKCTCKVNPKTCKENGAYNAATCSCSCKDGWTGLNCEDECKDTQGKECGRKESCAETHQRYAFMKLFCPSTCGDCRPKSKGKKMKTK